MTTIHQLLQNKGQDVWTIAPTDKVFHALELMAEKNIGALPVVENGRYLGLIGQWQIQHFFSLLVNKAGVRPTIIQSA